MKWSDFAESVPEFAARGEELGREGTILRWDAERGIQDLGRPGAQ